MKCIYVSSYLRDIDAHLSTLVHTDIPCEIVKSVIVSKAVMYKHAGRVILRAADMVWKLVTCKNNITVNVNQLRRDIDRIQCAPRKSKKGKDLILADPQEQAPPLPKGFVRPLFPPNWTPAWAREQGWIKDPFYDWLEPAADVKPVVPSKRTNDMSWIWWVIVPLVLIVIGYGGYLAYDMIRTRQQTSPYVDVDRAFMNAQPSVSMGPIDEMPNTTDLMNDFVNQTMTPSGRKSMTRDV